MVPRQLVLDLEKSWAGNAGRKVMFIPDTRVLSYLTPAECVELFEEEWGPEERPSVCLPLVGVEGVAFKNRVTPSLPVQAKRAENTVTSQDLGEVAYEFERLGCGVHLYVNPALEFLKIEACHVLDIRNVGSPQACVQRRKTREILQYFIALGIDHVSEHLSRVETLESLVVDITDLWGMSAVEGKLSLCCFCDECREALANSREGVRIGDFENHPNPWNLALQDAGNSISYIDNISKDATPDSIVGKSALRGFDSVFNTLVEKRRNAASLMRFMTARHSMVEDFLHNMFQEAYVGVGEDKRHPLKKVAVAEGSEYGWTSGVFPGHISSEVVDELWLDPSDKFPHVSLTFKTFMWRRATYFLNAFFEIVSNAADPRMRTTTALAHLPREAMRELIRRRGATAMNHQLSGLGQIGALPSGESTRNGLVGVVLTGPILNELIRNADIAEGLAGASGQTRGESLLG